MAEPMRVLAAVDGSEPAVRACRVAAELVPAEARFRILVVLSFELDPYTLLGEPVEETPETTRRAEEAVGRAAEAARVAVHASGHPVEVVHRFGNPADEILAEADAWSPDLLVVGRRGLGGAGRWLVGSVSDRVVRHAGVPVLIVA